MTQEQTRQLGIEFERRIQIMYPQSEILDKLDTNTIYAILNEYLIKYIKQLHVQSEQVLTNTKPTVLVQNALKSLLKHEVVGVDNSATQDGDTNVSVGALPTDYFLYVRSTSIVSSSYNKPSNTTNQWSVPNKIAKYEDVANLLHSPQNDGAIMRAPYVVLEDAGEEKLIKVYHDQYTTVDNVDVVYYKRPHQFNLIGYDDESQDPNAVKSYCELPYESFQDLVDGAINLYVNNYKFYLSLAANDRTRRSVEKAIGDMSNANKQEQS